MSAPAIDPAIDRVRAFNRFYTRVIGVLRPDLLGSPFGLTEARVLYELAHRDGPAAADLCRDLDLDAGYLSRILARLTRDGLVERAAAADDGRRRLLRLTPDGRAAFAALDAAQVTAVEQLLGPLDDARRAAVVAAMDGIRRAFGPPAGAAGPALRAPGPGDLGWVVSRHGARYAADHGWDATFETLVARIVADFGHGGREAAWIAELDGERVGSVFCTAAEGPAARGGHDVAQLRLLFVEPAARGRGIGSKLVAECLRFAAPAGYRRIVLWTQDVLVPARQLYARAGFRLDRSEPHHSFGHDLVGEWWSRDLAPPVTPSVGTPVTRP